MRGNKRKKGSKSELKGQPIARRSRRVLWVPLVLVAGVAASIGIWASTRSRPTLPPLPPARYEEQADGAKRVIVDPARMAAFCESLGLPEPPALASLDGVLAHLLYAGHAKVAEEPNAAEHYGALGDVYQAHNFPDRAIRCYERAIAHGDRFEWHYQIFRVRSEQGQPEEAIESLHRVLALNAEYAPAYFHLGEHLLQDGQLDAAEAAYRRYAHLRPQDENGYVGLAKIAGMRRDDQEALRQLRTAFERNPDDYRVHYQLSQLYQRQGKSDLAERHLGQYQSLPRYISFSDPLASRIRWLGTTPRRVQEIVHGLHLQERDEEGIRFSLRAAHRRPRSPPVLQALASSYRQAGKLSEALDVMRRAMEIDPTYFKGLTTLSEIYTSLERHDEALAVAEKAIRLASDNDFPHWLKGEALRRSGKLEESIPCYRRAVQLAPDKVVPARILAEVLLRTNRLAEARDAYQQVLRIKAGDPRAKERLKVVEQRLRAQTASQPAFSPSPDAQHRPGRPN